MTYSPDLRSHALVIGASIAGMCTARALSPHFHRVTLIERDTLSSEPEPRRGVPQGTQPHGILQRGRCELDALFPGLMDELKRQGAFEFDGSHQMARLTPQGWAPRYDNIGASAFACSRPLLEVTMRRLLMVGHPNVRLLQGVRVREPIHHKQAGEVVVTGVHTDSTDDALRAISGDLVVDATGRGTKLYKWLSQVGLPQPYEQRVDSKSNYATRHYLAPAEAKNWWWKAILVDSSPPTHARAASLLRVENGRWIVTAMGIGGDYAPTDEQGWLGFLASVRSPVIANLLSKAQPLGDVVQNRTTANIWRKMHEYRGKLSGLLLMGDCVCCFNPSYGQGLTATALAAQALSNALAGYHGPIDAGFLRGYYRRQAKFLKEGWAYSTTLDLRWPKTDGARSHLFGLQVWGANALETIAIHDPALMRKIIPLLDFGASRLSIVTPSFMCRCFVGLLRHAIARPCLPSANEFRGCDELLMRDGRDSSARVAAGTS